MLLIYFKTAWRSLFRNKGFTGTNLLGLTISIACSILIFLWVRDELSYDTFHKNYKNIYQIYANRSFKNGVYTDQSIAFPLNKALEKGYPQIKYAVEMTGNDNHVLAYKDTRLTRKGYIASDHFFNIFSWTFIKGNATTAISDPFSIVLTESTAKAFFDGEDPINKVLKMDNQDNLKVSAIVKDPPGNSSLSFDFIKSFNYSDPYLVKSMGDWNSASWNLFVQIIPGGNISQVTKTINDIMHLHDPNSRGGVDYFSFPMSRWRLYGDFKDGKNAGGLIEYVGLFSVIAVIILLIACINFMNLSTARSEKRAKEIGVRKTLGSDRKQLIWQFLFESVLLTAIAFVFSLILVLLLLPSFNLMVAKNLFLQPGDPLFWTGSIFIILFTGLIAGSYPAFYLSSFSPVKVLKGSFLSGRKAVLPRRALVVAQFVVSILLISATVIVYQQLQFIKNRELGYNPNNLITVTTSPDLNKNFGSLKQDLLSTGFVYALTRTLSPVTEIDWTGGPPDWEGKPTDLSFIIYGQTTDVDFAKTTGVQLLEGRDFSGTPSDTSSVLLNKSAIQAMHLVNPVGRLIRFQGKSFKVIGVTANMVMEDPYKPVGPMIISYQPNEGGAITIRLNKGITPRKALSAMEPIFQKYNPQFPFDYQFVDQEFGKKFRSEELISRIINVFAGLAIFICCIGLAGLASYTIEKRKREIGIRKVLGSTIVQLLKLISIEFLKLVLIALVIAFPLTWWVMNNWLEKYVFHIQISGWLFIVVSAILLLLTLAVVSLNALGAAMRNPVKSLRVE
jgi:putative ABC transport system permease protein